VASAYPNGHVLFPEGLLRLRGLLTGFCCPLVWPALGNLALKAKATGGGSTDGRDLTALPRHRGYPVTPGTKTEQSPAAEGLAVRNRCGKRKFLLG
jgi:hypothetical protein